VAEGPRESEGKILLIASSISIPSHTLRSRSASGADSLFSAAMTESAVSRPVRGFFGRRHILDLHPKRAASASTSMR